MTSPTWQSDDEPPHLRPSGWGWARVVLRAGLAAVVLISGVLCMLAIRAVERPLNGPRRPWSPYVTQTVCWVLLRIVGLRLTVLGRPDVGAGAIVSNHSTWLDILVLNAGQRVTFVAKEEVEGWPGIGLLARITGTLFVKREARAARGQVSRIEAAIAAGHQLLFFPEGTSTDGLRVLPFKATLFAPLTGHAVQPVSLAYAAPIGRDPRFYGWWGGMSMGPHLLDVLSTAPQGRVEVTYHPATRPDDRLTRKELAHHCEGLVRDGVSASLARNS